MITEDQTAGTPEPDDGDAQTTETTGTPETDGRNADGPGITKEELLAWKIKAEEFNRLKAEHEELRRRVEQSPAATNAQETQEIADDLEIKARALAQQGDAAAALALRNEARAMMLEQNIAHLYELSNIEDKSEREETREEFKKNRQRYGDIEAARAAVKARRLEAENKRLQEQIAAATAKPKDTVRTVYRESTDASPDFKTSAKTGAQFDAEVAKLRAAGKWKAANALSAELANGKITLKD